MKQSCNKLTVIIPFLNEGEEVRNTVQSIIDHSEEPVHIILINDGSDDGHDYALLAQEFENVEYVVNRKRIGVAASRDVGVSLCKNPYFLLLDAHMRFYCKKWQHRIVSELEKNDRQLLCCQTRSIKKGQSKIKEQNISADVYETYSTNKVFGAYISINNGREILKAHWKKTEKDPASTQEAIPCVLGAAYAASKRYWEYLKGLNGLEHYSTDEPYISLKVWLEGGQCTLLKDVLVGHIYRNGAPYQLNSSYIIYNKLFMAELFFPDDTKADIFRKFQTLYPQFFPDAYRLLTERKEFVENLKAYYKQIFTHDINLIFELNQS